MLSYGAGFSANSPSALCGCHHVHYSSSFGGSIVIFSLSTVFWISLAALAIYGASDMVSVYIRLTLVQLATPDEMRGRVSAVIRSL